MINKISAAQILENQKTDENDGLSPEDKKFVLLPFYFGGKPLVDSDERNFPRWGMTLLRAGTMRFRWNEENPNREKFFDEILATNKHIVPIELIHSKIVVEAEDSDNTKNVKADGIITKNRDLIPTVTVADCVPVFLFDTKTRAFGVFHSGWKGTGIAGVGVQKMKDVFGSKPEDISAAIGPHIGKCCYCIDEERAEYFRKNFGEKCVSKIEDCRVAPCNDTFRKSGNDNLSKFPYSLSLTEANLFVLKNAGIKEENIVVATDCTCCSKFSNGKNVFGSFRRQAAFLPPEITKEERSKSMTVQAAFVIDN